MATINAGLPPESKHGEYMQARRRSGIGGLVSFLAVVLGIIFLMSVLLRVSEIRVEGNDERVLLIARFDNLGKGASGAAIQNMNILLGVDETTGLYLQRRARG